MSSPTTWLTIASLAEGGMGRIELAIDPARPSSGLVVLKRLRSALVSVPAFRKMFADEARVAGLLHHPHIVSVRSQGADAGGPYLVMDYVEGIDVAALVARAAATGERLPVQLCARVCAQAAAGLHAAHEQLSPSGQPLHLVHRDVSPANLLIGYDGTVRVTDFGIAKAIGRLTRTAAGVTKGKGGYMSPEQIRAVELDRRSDLFSLGVVLFEMLAARRLYGDEDSDRANQRILYEPTPDIGDERDDVHPAVVQLVFRLLAKDPNHRPPSAWATAAALDEVAKELALVEGPVRVADHVASRFAARRDQERAYLGALVAEALANSSATGN